MPPKKIPQNQQTSLKSSAINSRPQPTRQSANGARTSLSSSLISNELVEECPSPTPSSPSTGRTYADALSAGKSASPKSNNNPPHLTLLAGINHGQPGVHPNTSRTLVFNLKYTNMYLFIQLLAVLQKNNPK